MSDTTTGRDALAVLERYQVHAPEAIADILRESASRSISHLAPDFRIVARARDALDAATRVCRAEGIDVVDLGDSCEGEARAVAAGHLAHVRAGAGREKPWLLISGGELTVTVRGEGRGGPNTEYALALLSELERAPVPGIEIWALAADTDGTDGTADAAGAIVTPSSCARAAALGLRPERSLQANDSAGFFELLGDLFRPGPTLTNVNDLRAILAIPRKVKGSNTRP